MCFNEIGIILYLFLVSKKRKEVNMKKKLFIILGVFVVNISLVLSFALKKEDNKVITKEKTVEMGNLPSGIMAYTVNGEKTS